MKPKYTNSARYKCLEYLKSIPLTYILAIVVWKNVIRHFYGPIARSEYLIHYILSGKGMYQVDGKHISLERTTRLSFTLMK